jgi:arylsulfatase A-like enzyme
MNARKSVVLVTVDCLRADHCGFMGYHEPITPFLDGLARESFIFPTAIVSGAPTYFSLPGILASRYPLSLGREVIGLAVHGLNLASVLRQEGYATAFLGAGNPYLSAQFGYDFGFDTFHDSMESELAPLVDFENDLSSPRKWTENLNRTLANLSHRIPGAGAAYEELYFHYCQMRAAPVPPLDALRRFPAADVMVDKAQSWLTSVRGKPFFLWLHFMDPHAPYYPKPEALQVLARHGLTASRARYLNAYWNRSDIGSKRLSHVRDQIVALYDAGICWVDAQLSRLIGTLHRSNLWEDCIFVLTADHGEEFLEHEGRYHSPSLTEELIHVPLLLRVPGAAKKELSSNPFSLLHLAPTLLEAAGSAVPFDFQGQSHWIRVRDGSAWSDPAVAESVAHCANPYHPEQRRGSRLLAIRGARYKLLLNFDSHSEDLFDLQNDPGEQSPLVRDAAKPERRRLLQAALAHLRTSNQRRDAETYLRTRLREIGLNLTTAISSPTEVSVHLGRLE